MANAIQAKDFAGAVINELSKYRQVTQETFERVVDEMGKETTQQLKVTSPKHRNAYKGERVPGTYAKSWTYATKKIGKTYAKVVYSKSPEYRLTHLLEYGHARVQGGRVPAQPHIRKAEQQAIAEFERRLLREL